MGICLDTDQGKKQQASEDADTQKSGEWREEAGLLATPPNGSFPMQNVGPVKFESPSVPVIFVLGGPGSGKVTHCDNLTQEKKGIAHINMTDLLQQYAMGSDMQDFSSLSSKTVTEVLMLEIKMSPGAKTFLVSGYPRNMRDVVEYSEKIQIVNGVILLSWRREVLERQIDYGAQLGHVILTLARMELNNFFRSVMPVAEYFDQSGLLLQVNGERNPSEVYVDFREAVYKILGLSADGTQAQSHNNPAKNASIEAEVEVERQDLDSASSPKKTVVTETIPITINMHPSKTADKSKKGLPAFIWVIGGPGSNKSIVCTQAIRNMPGWMHISIGEILRSMASSNIIVNDAVVSGEIVPLDIVMQVVEQQVLMNRDNDGIVINGFPRDLNQVHEFENKFGKEPPLVLLDCSKLQLSRGRSDDSVASFRKRLEIFREVTLPMLKTLDSDNRLTVIDGDTEVPSVQQEFATVLYQISRRISQREENEYDSRRESLRTANNANSNGEMNGGPKGNHIPNGVAIPVAKNKINLQKNDENRIEETKITGGAKLANGFIKNAKNLAAQQNGKINGAVHFVQNGAAQLSNGVIPNNKIVPVNENTISKDSIKKMYNEVEQNIENLHI